MKNKAAQSKAWKTVQIARHPERPQFLDYVGEIFTEFDALHGDRLYGDDGAMVGGLARFNGQAVMVNCSDQPHLTIYHDGTKNPGDGVYEYSEDYVGTIFYKRIFTPGTWETLYLPFEVEKVTVEDDGEYKLSPWQLSNGGNYYLAEPVGVQNGELYFDFTTTLEANKPYIIQFPEKNGYYNDRVVTFHGTRKWNELSTSTYYSNGNTG